VPYQAKAPPTQSFGAEAFDALDRTELRWLGMAGLLINSRGTVVMIDPVLRDFDMPILIEMPIAAGAVPRLDGVLVTHSDNDHYSVPTCHDLSSVTSEFHSTHYVASLMADQGFEAHGHDIGQKFEVGALRVTTTPADHAWQNEIPGQNSHWFVPEDACGFWIETPDGTIWAPGDSRVIPEHHMSMPPPDVLLFDFSDSEWHFGLDGAISIANTYPDAELLLHHWGSVDAPEFTPFNADPVSLQGRVSNPDRVHALAPGEPLVLRPRPERQ
jgi:L-ascorbate metabolism protein UlaG (beta-lactamase superfamily)